jgi:hypothetical protein
VKSSARFPRAQALDFEYWLGRCEGFSVDSPSGRVGFVEWLRFQSRLERRDALVVRAGPFGRRQLVVPVEEVAEISPSKGLIVLRTAPDGAGDGFVRRLRGRSAARRATSGSRHEYAG